MKKIKFLSLAIVLSLGLIGITGCGNESKNNTTTKQETKNNSNTTDQKEIKIKDQNGREVTVKYPVKRIACMQHHSLDILTQLGVLDKVVCTEDKLERDLGQYIVDMHPELKNMPRTGTLKEPNVEAIAKQKPDLVLVAAQANPDAIKALEKLNIPTLVITLRGEGKQAEAQNPHLSNADKAYTDGLEWVVKTLGKLTNTEDRAEKLWNFCMESRKLVEEKLSNIDDSHRVKVFVANENNHTYGDDKYVGCQLLRAGAINVAAKEIKGYKQYNLEQLAKWNPDTIIVQDRYPEVLKQITTDKQYSELKAVKNKNVIVAPYWTKPWGNPDTDSIALGELWLAHKFYPEKLSADIVLQRAKEFYKTFYGIDFSGKVD